jgi:hypothetical protein
VPYFDHVRCHACKAMLDPESLGGGGDGRGLICPRCGAALDLKDLFGLNAAFDEEEEGPVSLDDLVPRGSKPPPAPSKPASPSKPAPSKPAPGKPAPGKPVQAKPPLASSTGLVHQPAPEPDDEPPAKGSALDAMRALKKKKR